MNHYTDIIVGAGSAGATLAARLAEDPERNVLLVEAGPDYPQIDQLPADLASSDNAAYSHDWNWNATASSAGNEIGYFRGKVVGGTSQINGAIALRPDPRDLERWVALGNDEWTWDAVLPYFIKLERDLDFGEAEYHGADGPLPIVRWRPEELAPVQQALISECVARGFRQAADFNAPGEHESVAAMPMNAPGRHRVSTAEAYLPAVRALPNFTLRADAPVQRVVVDDGRAVGIEILTAEGSELVGGDNIVISGGAIATPGLLLRSGIGPAAEVERIGVDLVVDAPGVGINLQDHPSVVLAFEPKPGVCTHDAPVVQALLRFQAPGSDEPNDMNLYAYTQIDISTQFRGVGDGAGDVPLAFMLGLQIAQANSRGRITFPSADIDAVPDIQLDFCSDPEDMRRMVDGLRFAWEVAQSDRIQEHAVRILTPTAETLAGDDATIADYIINNLETGYHPVGTAKMGPPSDPEAVVDQHGRVYGVAGLRVVDASVIPVIPRANTNLSCIMLGERIADFMKAGDGAAAAARPVESASTR